MKKLFWAAAAAALALLLLAPNAASSSYLIKEKGGQVVMLTPPSKEMAGGTGFHVRAPSGTVYILTNGHICALAEGGKLRAHVPATERSILVSVIEVSTTTDLCLASSLPAQRGIDVASATEPQQQFYVLGHPGLRPLTLTEGRITALRFIKLFENVELEECVGPGRSIVEVPGFFGPMQACVRQIWSAATSAFIFGGNSGSPALNQDGELVGVVFAADNYTNYGELIPLEDVKEFLSVF